MRERALNGQGPLLGVAQRVIARHAQNLRRGSACDVGRLIGVRHGEDRIPWSVQLIDTDVERGIDGHHGDVVPHIHVVEDTVGGADHGLVAAEGPPCQSEARREMAIVPIVEISRRARRREDLAGNQIEVRSEPANVADGRVQLPAQAHADGQFRGYFPVVSEEAVPAPAEKPGELLSGADAWKGSHSFPDLIGPVEQEVRKGRPGLAAGEVEGPLDETEGLAAQQDVLEVRTGFHRVSAMAE